MTTGESVVDGKRIRSFHFHNVIMFVSMLYVYGYTEIREYLVTD